MAQEKFYLQIIIVQVDNDLEAGKLTIPSLTYTGNVTQTGDIFTNDKEIVGTVSVDNINVARDAFLKQIDIVGGNIQTLSPNSDLKIKRNRTRKSTCSGNNVRIDNNIRWFVYSWRKHFLYRRC